MVIVRVLTASIPASAASFAPLDGAMVDMYLVSVSVMSLLAVDWLFGCTTELVAEVLTDRSDCSVGRAGVASVTMDTIDCG